MNFYQQFTPELPINTLRWRIYELKQRGIIYSPQRGVYALLERNLFNPDPSPDMEKIASLLKERFPYVRFNIYLTRWFNQLTNHIYQTNNLIVEIDGDVLETAFYFLRERYPNTFLSPNQEMYDHYILSQETNLMVNRLHVDAPLLKVSENYFMPKLEKIIVDLVINDPVIFPVETAEIKNMIENALDVYEINYSTLFRYAEKRKAKQRLGDLKGLGEGEEK